MDMLQEIADNPRDTHELAKRSVNLKMSFNIPPFLVYTASWFGAMGGVWALFDRAEKVVDPQVKAKISNWLLTARVPFEERWPVTFKNLSDRVFGEKLVSVKSAFVSVLFSIGSIIVIFAICIYLKPGWLQGDIKKFGIVTLFSMWLVAAGFTNFLQDYLSVIETRFLLRKMATRPTLKFRLAFLLLDFLLTSALIWITFFIIVKGLEPDQTAIETTGVLIDSLKLEKGLAPFVYSTYLTSAWIWLYILSGLAVRLVGKFSWSLEIAKKFLNIEEKPLLSMGFISMLIVSVVYLVIPFL